MFPPPSPLYNVGSDEVDLQNISCNYTNIVEGGGGQCLKIHKVYNFFHHAGLYVSYYMYCICMYLYMYCMYCTVLYYMYCIYACIFTTIKLFIFLYIYPNPLMLTVPVGGTEETE